MSTANATTHAAIAATIAAAIASATEAVATLPDNGTCNLDYVTLRVPRCSAALERAVREAGVAGFKKRGPGRYHVASGMRVGQAARSTAFCQRLADALRAEGLTAHVQYVTD